MTATKPVLVDSSGWVEVVGQGLRAGQFEKLIAENEPVILPTVVLYEVYKKLMRTVGKDIAIRFLSHALRQVVVPLDEHLAIAAAAISLSHSLPMADAMIYATAKSHDAELFTTDAHFQALPGVTVL